ncbi:MAG: T9SS type A sorting domain-containing protein [Flavobacteriaceae bacterium]|nr:T9SS type A sorting domain-containing protein [Flavobacteriaceae bacterium]
MKKITLCALFLCGTFMFGQQLSTNPDAPYGSNSDQQPAERGTAVTLSHSVNPFTVDTGGVACWNSANGEYRDNAFARTYDLATDFAIAGDFEIQAVEWGQGTGDDGKVIDVNIYTVDFEDLSVALFTLIASESFTISSADDLSLITYPITALIPAGSIVAVEVFAPDEGTVANQRLFPGFNLSGQTQTAWLKSDGTGTGGANTGCGIPWTDSNTVVADPQEYVINLVGEEVVLGVGDNIADLVNIYPNPATTQLNVEVPSGVDILEVKLYDVLGKDTGARLVNGTVDVSALSRGVYVLSVNTSKGALTEKIVKR